MKPVASKDVLLLDTNVWRYILDSQAEAEVRRVAFANRVAIAVAPAALYEAFRTRDPILRTALVKVMTSPVWKRLMPEAYDEAAELLGEIRRLYPRWLLTTPRLDEYRRLKDDWARPKGGFWNRARYDCAGEAGRLAQLEDDMITRALDEAHSSRKRFSDAKWRCEKIDLNNVKRRTTECPLVVLDHEKLLQHSKVRVTSTVAPGFPGIGQVCKSLSG